MNVLFNDQPTLRDFLTADYPPMISVLYSSKTYSKTPEHIIKNLSLYAPSECKHIHPYEDATSLLTLIGIAVGVATSLGLTLAVYVDEPAFLEPWQQVQLKTLLQGIASKAVIGFYPLEPT